MRLVTYLAAEGPRSGCLLDNDGFVLDFAHAHTERYAEPCPAALQQVVQLAEAGADALDHAYELARLAPSLTGKCVRPVQGLTLLAPIPQPPQMRDFLCFEKHLHQGFQQARRLRAALTSDPDAAMAQMERDGIFKIPDAWYERPLFYHPSRFSVTGPEATVTWPSYSRRMDFELEFGIYIGKSGKDIAREKARDHIFGYTIFNDFSARDEQVRDMPGLLGPGKGKDFDGANAMGPCLVTADEIPDPYNLEMAVRVNGEEWGRGNTRDMHWKFEDLISHISRSETLHAGEFFGSGTVGDGCGMEHDRFLQDGDLVELEVERIGILRNRVIASQVEDHGSASPKGSQP
ncbi:fumarylacetoacetate hydrolase family protein [Novosphingobium terrae]|uniref:fumarylacetoacetate hydrolase family protein n=1 Tax=Novosphingobium terrae TaxID=2726189 RepID=UPI00198241B0|nr:fumarylacetoacetate hydrolase family protein [Novosphingobium terrae]